MENKGLIHFYYGYGKGKTTAALGLALRASGCGKKVILVQFLKGKETGELSGLRALPGITVLRGQAGKGFAFAMSPEQKKETLRIHNENLKKAIDQMDTCDLLILDEAIDAWQLGLLDDKLFREVVDGKPEGMELVVTGHKSEAWLVEKADYVTEMVKHKHPYDQGVKARQGIEF